jgi:tetratricopeptide (TPR) repeat protein
MSYLHGCKQTPPTPPTTSDEDSSGSSDDPEAKKKKGNRAMGKKKYPKAVKYYSKAIKIDGTQATYYLNRAIANAALELWKAAEADAAKALELGDVTPKSHYQLARARLRRANIDGAEEALAAGTAAFPEAAALTQLAAEIKRERSRIQAREAKQKEADSKKEPVQDGPSSVRALLEQARTAYGAGRLEDAISSLATARSAASAVTSAAGGVKAVSPAQRNEQVSILSLSGKAKMQLRRWAEATEDLEAVVAIEEETYSMDNKEEREALSNAYNNLGIAYKNAGRLSDAVTAMNKAYHRATNGDDQVASFQASQILQNVGQCLRAQKKSAEARRFFERAMEIGIRHFHGDHASHALNHLCIARCLKDEGQIRGAIQSYTKAYEIWTSKDPKELLAEMPEVPNKERLDQLVAQCRGELGQLVSMVEQAREQHLTQQAGYTESADVPVAT